jgi:hypothetical protein
MGEHNGKVLIWMCAVIPEHIHFEGIVPHCREETMSLERNKFIQSTKSDNKTSAPLLAYTII